MSERVDGRMEWARGACRCWGRRSDGHVTDGDTRSSINRCQYGHLRGQELLIYTPVRQRAWGMWRRPSIFSLSLCVSSVSFCLTLHPFASSHLSCPSPFHTSTSLLPSSLQHSSDAFNHSNTVSNMYVSPLLYLYLPLPFSSIHLPGGERNNP